VDIPSLFALNVNPALSCLEDVYLAQA
jgi:hypothetical protein